MGDGVTARSIRVRARVEAGPGLLLARGHAPEAERRGYLEKGIAAAQQAARLEPGRPEGHFWLAADMGALAEKFGVRAGLKYRKPIREELETVLRLDPAFMQGSADRALGRYYFEVPGLFGGSKSRAEQHLRASLAYNADSTISRYFLAELLIDQKRTAEARAELQRVIAAPISDEWAPEDREVQEESSRAPRRASLTQQTLHAVMRQHVKCLHAADDAATRTRR